MMFWNMHGKPGPALCAPEPDAVQARPAVPPAGMGASRGAVSGAAARVLSLSWLLSCCCTMEMELLPPSRLLLLVPFKPARQAEHLFSTRQEQLALLTLLKPCFRVSKLACRARQRLLLLVSCRARRQACLEGGQSRAGTGGGPV